MQRSLSLRRGDPPQQPRLHLGLDGPRLVHPGRAYALAESGQRAAHGQRGLGRRHVRGGRLQRGPGPGPEPHEQRVHGEEDDRARHDGDGDARRHSVDKPPDGHPDPVRAGGGHRHWRGDQLHETRGGHRQHARRQARQRGGGLHARDDLEHEQHRAHGVEQHGRRDRGHRLHVFRRRLQLRRRGRRGEARERYDRDAADTGDRHAQARRLEHAGGSLGHEGADRQRQAHLLAIRERVRGRPRKLQLQGKRRARRERRRLHDDHRCRGDQRPGHGCAPRHRADRVPGAGDAERRLVGDRGHRGRHEDRRERSLPVEAVRLGRNHCRSRHRNRTDLHPRRGRRGESDRGRGDLQRRRRVRGVDHQRSVPYHRNYPIGGGMPCAQPRRRRDTDMERKRRAP